MSIIRPNVLLAVIFLLGAAIVNAEELERSNPDAINKLVDEMHQAAAQGDKDHYLNCFSKQAVFMGTDDWERWPIAEFTDYVNKRFKDGQGWAYKSLERHIDVAKSGETAWFDEITFSEKWGRFRGTGVVVKEDDEWKIAHYSMSVLVPNEAWEEITTIAGKSFAERAKQSESE